MNPVVRTSSALALILASSQAYALGLGEARVRSNLSEPLLIEIPVLGLGGVSAEDLRVELPRDTGAAGQGASQFILPHDVRVQVTPADGGGARGGTRAGGPDRGVARPGGCQTHMWGPSGSRCSGVSGLHQARKGIIPETLASRGMCSER